MKYYETGDTIFGEKIVDPDFNMKEMIEKYKSKGEVAIITDKVSNYTGIPGVKVVPYHKMQGMETDYVFVDVDFAANNTFGGSVSKYAMLRDLYTISQRSRVASIIKSRGIPSDFIENVKSPEYGRPRTMNEDDKTTFKARRKEILETLPVNDSFYDYIYDFKTVPAPTAPVTATASTPGSVPGVAVTGGNPSSPAGSAPGSNPNPVSGGGGNPGTPSVPGTPKPTSIPEGAKSMFRRGSARVDNREFHGYLADPNFRNSETSSPNSILSWKSRQLEKSVQIPQPIYKNLIRYMSSSVRTGRSVDIDMLLRGIIDFSGNTDKEAAGNLTMKLKRIFSTTPEIYISEYDAERRIITAVYKDNDDVIQIPVGFTRTSAVGRYDGTFKRNKNIAITHSHT